jgi:SAM-dependent methyltransferase
MTVREDYAHLTSERSVELPWLLERTLTFPALDVGCHESVYLHHYADALTPLDGIDIRPQTRNGLRNFYQDDIRTWEAPMKYATVIALSTIEHIGLANTDYGCGDDDMGGGDRAALEGCMRALRPGGVLLLTVPFGDTHENRGWYRRYNARSLTALLDGFKAVNEFHHNPEWGVGGVALCQVWQ